MTDIRILSTDFDGTLIGGSANGRCVPALAEQLERHRDEGGFWAVNTGRSLNHALEGLEQFRAPVEPDFLLTNEREIFRRSALAGWEDFGEWNGVCREVHEVLFAESAEIFGAIERALSGMGDVTFIEENLKVAGLITANDAVMDRVVDRLRGVRLEFPDFHFQRNTVYLRFCHIDYDKGTALKELGRLLEIPADEIFAIGDHHNDLPMLDGESARHVGCPANAIREVREQVGILGGHIARADYGEGAAEAIAAVKEREL